MIFLFNTCIVILKLLNNVEYVLHILKMCVLVRPELHGVIIIEKSHTSISIIDKHTISAQGYSRARCTVRAYLAHRIEYST